MSGFPGLLPASGPGCAPRAVPPLRDRRPPGPAAAAKAEDSWGTRLGLRVLPLQPTLPLPEAGSQRPPGGYPGARKRAPVLLPRAPGRQAAHRMGRHDPSTWASGRRGAPGAALPPPSRFPGLRRRPLIFPPAPGSGGGW